MKILYLAHRIPFPPNKGDKLRSCHELTHLARKHDVWCACFVDDPSDLNHVATLQGICKGVKAIRLHKSLALPLGIWNLAKGKTFTEGYYQHLEMVRTLREWNESIGFDAVLVFSSGMAPYAQYINANRKILDFCDLDSHKWMSYSRQSAGLKSMLFGIEGLRLAQCELDWLGEFDASILITEAEAADIRKPQIRRKLHIVSNGVELPPPSPVVPDTPFPIVGFSGAMDYPPNVDAVRWFAEEIWPRIRREHTTARFQIVGRHPARAVRSLKYQPGIDVVGEVDNIQSFIRDFRVSVAPIRIARGLQNKVLEAMAASRPVVLTTAAATGLDGTDGNHYYVTDNPGLFALHVRALLEDEEECERVGNAARAYVSHRHSWSREMEKLEALLMDNNQPGTPVKGKHNLVSW